MNTTQHSEQAVSHTSDARDQLQGFIVVVASAAVLVGLAMGAMSLLSSPAGWVMKAANQVMTDHHQAIATSYAVNLVD